MASPCLYHTQLDDLFPFEVLYTNIVLLRKYNQYIIGVWF